VFKKTFLVVLICVLALPLNLESKERRGADLIIRILDGQFIRGELIAVRETSLLLMDSQNSADETVDIDQISSITVVKRLKIGYASVAGFVAGGALGAYAVGSRTYGKGETELVIIVGLLGGVTFGTIATLLSGAMASNETIALEGMSDAEINETLNKLRLKARVRDYN
jgi:hypothetical protein